MFYVDAGTVHAIWPGSVLLETQQNSDITYRMYDYGRGRELHIEKSLEAMRLSTSARKITPSVSAGSDGPDRRGLLLRGADSGGSEPFERHAPGRRREGPGAVVPFCSRRAKRGFQARALERLICRHAGLSQCRRLRRYLLFRTLADWTSFASPRAGRSGMTQNSWRESVVAYIRAEARPIDKFGHQPRLYALAKEIGEGMEYDDDVLFAAAWMHDLGVFLGHRPEDPTRLASWDHVPYTIERSRELLKEWGFPAEKLEGVAEAIRCHQAEGRTDNRGGNPVARCRYSGTTGRDRRDAHDRQGRTRHALSYVFVRVASFVECS